VGALDWNQCLSRCIDVPVPCPWSVPTACPVFFDFFFTQVHMTLCAAQFREVMRRTHACLDRPTLAVVLWMTFFEIFGPTCELDI